MFKLKIALIALFACFVFACKVTQKAGDGNATPTPAPTAQQDAAAATQGWTTEDRRAFYHTSQGTRVVPYKWFLAVEEGGFAQQPFFTDARAARYNLIPDPDTTNNPDRLPVGLVKDVASDGEFISVTCAACHTGQIRFNGTTMRVDGGPAMTNLNGFFREMYEGIGRTLVNLPKFERFAQKVLGDRNSLIERARLREQMTKSLVGTFAKILQGKVKDLYPTEEGFGRLDALGRGGNLVLATGIGDEHNLAVGNAPVSFPHLWGTPSFDWVQWNGSIQQPMARNVGEALGVNTPVALKGDPADLFKSEVKIENVHLMETLLQKLQPPRWPEALLGQIDREKAARGDALYRQHCAVCHESQPAPPNEFGKVFLRINMYPLEVIGTDPNDAVNFNRRTARTGQLGKPPVNLPPTVTAAAATQFVAGEVAKRKYDELGIPPEKRQEMDGFRPNNIRAPLGYRARNMDGIWATAPYLHNNSVPNLYQLLLPADKRDARFFVGNLEYDPKAVGFQTGSFPGGFELRTNITGNSNAGHEFRDGARVKGVIGPLLTDDERWAIIEYLKTR
ncbi:MAG TPA: di-heme-cytochrome C peroxidase [Pyrinomonadaceae bacterium]|jgi:cytochrome c2|nr:di-heme-cytochrome C peroxidase [Pyrinomonadaceae bacterium]